MSIHAKELDVRLDNQETKAFSANATAPDEIAARNIVFRNAVNRFDQYKGHPTGGDMYAYHFDPSYLTETNGKSSSSSMGAAISAASTTAS